jgi:hypothetical protein
MGSDNFHGIPNASHWVHADNPQDFQIALEKIIKRDGTA